jgi:hypothetical protein
MNCSNYNSFSKGTNISRYHSKRERPIERRFTFIANTEYLRPGLGLKGYTYGVTVDPIRLDSLREFGVAANIVMAELRRDGVMNVTTGRDPVKDADTGAYDVEYISDGSKGRKYFVTRTMVKAGKLRVLTVMCKQDDWKQVEDDVWASVSTFKVLDPSSFGDRC